MCVKRNPQDDPRSLRYSRGSLTPHDPRKHGADRHDFVHALSCTFRAGRAGASTDHSSILFNVDPKTGVLGKGTINAEWYRMGLKGSLLAAQSEEAPVFSSHPDNGARISGRKVSGSTLGHI
jgi:hypothetical protein